MNIKKLVIKTIVITVLTLVLMCLAVFGILTAFSPKTVGNFFDGVGSYSVAVSFYEREYLKTGDIYDLAFLLNKLDEEKSPDKTQKYSAKMVKNSKFSNYCEKEDLKSNSKIKTSEYVYGKLVVATFLNEGVLKAIEYCEEAVSLNGYTDYNAFRILISSKGRLMTNEELLELKNSINGLILEGNAENIKEKDILTLQSLLG